MKKQKFWAMLDNDAEQVDGYDVDELVFVYKLVDGFYGTRWYIADKATGLAMPEFGATRKAAIDHWKSECIQLKYARIRQKNCGRTYTKYANKFDKLVRKYKDKLDKEQRK